MKSLNKTMSVKSYLRVTVFIPVLMLLLSSCASRTTIMVLNAETKEPIVGAVGIAIWTKNKGFFGGFELSTYTAKAVEAVSDKNGHLAFPSVSGSYAISIPHVKVYKPGYVGWDSKRIYFGHHPNDKKRMISKRRENFVMKDQEIFLEPWKDEYTYISHGHFISINGGLYEAGLPTSIYKKTIRYEIPYLINERRALSKEFGKEHEMLHKKQRNVGTNTNFVPNVSHKKTLEEFCPQINKNILTVQDKGMGEGSYRFLIDECQRIEKENNYKK